MNKQVKILLGLPLVAVLALGGIHIYKMVMYPTWFSRVSLHDSEEAVREKMGAPVKVNSGPHMWCKEPGTVRELLYGASFPPEWRVVGFDAQGLVTCMTHLSSP